MLQRTIFKGLREKIWRLGALCGPDVHGFGEIHAKQARQAAGQE